MSYSPCDLDNIEDGILYGGDAERIAIARSVVSELRELRRFRDITLARRAEDERSLDLDGVAELGVGFIEKWAKEGIAADLDETLPGRPPRRRRSLGKGREEAT